MVCDSLPSAPHRAPRAALTPGRVARRLWYAALHMFFERAELDDEASIAPHGYALRMSATGDADLTSWFILEPRAIAGCKCGFCRTLGPKRRRR